MKSQKKTDNNLPILTEKLKYRHSQSRQKRERDRLGILGVYSILSDNQLFLQTKVQIKTTNLVLSKDYLETNSFSSFLNNSKPSPKTKTTQLNNI